jgi:hypothetical protein
VGILGGVNPLNVNQNVGAFGRSKTLGVFGFADASGGTGVAGNTAAGNGIGVHGHTSTGIGVHGTSEGPGPAGNFAGDVIIQGTLTVNGQHLLDEFAQLQQTIAQLQQAIAQLQQQLSGRRTDAGLPVSPPQSRPKLKVEPIEHGVKILSSFTTNINNHFHATFEDGSFFDQGVANLDFFFLTTSSGNRPGSYTVTATDSITPDPNDNTGVLWSDPVHVTIP